MASINSLFIASTLYVNCNQDFCAYVYIDRLQPVYNGIVYVGTSGDEKNLNCKPESGVYLTLNPNHVGAERIYSTLLSAQMSGKTLVVNVDDNLKDSAGACWVRWVNAKN